MDTIIADCREKMMWGRLYIAILLMGLLLGGCAGRNASFTFVHVTDTHAGTSDGKGSRAAEVERLYREISGRNAPAAFVINTGDLTESGTEAEFAIHRKTLAELTVRQYATAGNHDIRWNPLGKEGYERGAGKRYQSWDYGGVHFVLLDSTVLLQHWGHIDQEQLDWLKRDLKKVGPEKPIVIGMHHPIGREGVQVDNEGALLEAVRAHNVRLWLFGHGHSDLQWNINGAPAVEAKGLYQGSYHIIEVAEGRICVQRRVGENVPVDVLTASLAKDLGIAERMKMSVSFAEQEVVARRVDDSLAEHASAGSGIGPGTARLDLLGKSVSWFRTEEWPNAAVEMRVDGGAYVPMVRDGDGYAGKLPADLVPGRHEITGRVTLRDGRACFATLPLSGYRSDVIKAEWQTDLKGAVQSHLVCQGETVYVTTMGGDLVAVDRRTGQGKWRFHTDGAIFATPCVGGGVVYVGSADHFVYAVDAASGKLKWKTRTGGGVFAGSAIAQGMVCAASVDRVIYGLDAKTGQVRWRAPVEGMYQSNVATDGERFFLGGWDNQLRCIEAKTGKQIWANRFGKSMYYSPAIASPAVGEGKVFITSNDGVLHAVDAASGEVVWEFDGKKLGYSSPLYHAGRVYAAIGEGGRVFCFDASSGRKAWESSAGGTIYDSSFVLAGDCVCIGSVNGVVSAFGAADGALRWQYSLGMGHLMASPASDGHCVFVGSMNGKLVALPVRAGAAD